MEEEKKVVEEQKKSKLPIILLVLVLLIGVGCGGYFLGKKANSKPKDDTKTEEKEQSKEETTNGNDTNTSDLKILDTKTKNITLNGKTYELKIEALLAQTQDLGGETAELYSQNVYINGHKFIDKKEIKYPALTLSTQANGYYKEAVEYELNDVKTLKDTSNSEEYLVFSDCTNGYGGDFYIVKVDGTIIKQMLRQASGSGLDIFTNNPSNNNYYIKNPLYNDSRVGEEGKYQYMLKTTWPNEVFDNSILHISGWKINGKEEKFDSYFSCSLSEPDRNNFELYINKLTISNGVVNDTKEITITNNDKNYYVSLAGACQ